MCLLGTSRNRAQPEKPLPSSAVLPVEALNIDHRSQTISVMGPRLAAVPALLGTDSVDYTSGHGSWNEQARFPGTRAQPGGVQFVG